MLPLPDVLKTRMQLQNELVRQSKSVNVFRVAYQMVRTEGVTSLGRGMTAQAIRELFYSTLRLGLYEPFKHQFGNRGNGPDTFSQKFAAGGLSGIIGAAVANPADLLKGEHLLCFEMRVGYDRDRRTLVS